MDAGPPSPDSRQIRPGLDGVRGLAVAAVVAYHLGHLPGGFLGVDLFFVLSGYLITGIVLREAASTGSISLRRFWGRRIRRLVPALLVVTTTVVGAALALGWPGDERRDLAIDAFATLTWWQNWRQAGGASYWESGESLFRHAWSLSIEEQFYVLWPLVLVAVVAVAGRRRRDLAVWVGATALVGAVASSTWLTVLSNRLADDELSRAYVGTDTRVLAPLLGCALAAWTARWPGAAARRAPALGAGVVGAVVLGAMWVLADVSDPALYRQGGFVLAALAAAALVHAASHAEAGHRDPLGWATTRRWARYLGTRSYGIYLWSWPLQVLLVFQFADIGELPLAVATVAGSLLLAELSHRFVEAPLRHRSGWASDDRARRPAWAAGLASSAVVVALALVTATSAPVHEQIDTAQAASDALRPALTVPPTTEPAMPGGDPGDGAPGSGPGEAAGAPLRVMITGDSVAWTLGYYAPTGDDLPEGIASVDSRAIIGCGLLSSEGWEYRIEGSDAPFRRAPEACVDQPEAERIGLSASPDVVLIVPGAWEWGEVRSPDGEVYAAQSPELAEVLAQRMLDRIDAAHDVGAAVALVEWICPGPDAEDERADPDFIAWLNDLLAATAQRARSELGAEVGVLQPNEQVCEGGVATGQATPAKDEAMDREVHVQTPEGGAWAWSTWLGPGLQALA
jgi:peptidoglycan/LPS O-acetylase OafA/YrhL